MKQEDDAVTPQQLKEIDWGSVPTPAYVYDFEVVGRRISRLKGLFDGLFAASFAVKSNPNLSLLRFIAGQVPHIDASSAHEVERALFVGVEPSRISWSGPGKRASEFKALAGRGITIVIEAEDEVEMLADVCASAAVVQNVVLRINPDHVPKGFGASMSGKPSQFGVDEADSARVISRIMATESLSLIGFHAYTGSMCLTPSAIAENIQNLCQIFGDAARRAGIRPKKLIFGAGFGVPYHTGQEPLDVGEVRALVGPMIEALGADPDLGEAERLLEIGRWITAPSGALVTTVMSAKTSRGAPIAVCDAGFNNHLAAAGMMGSVFQKNYPFAVLKCARLEEDTAETLLAGPLCTSIDMLARKIAMPPLSRGDVLAVMMSGAYGLTASPTRFISHAEPKEYRIEGDALRDISESGLNRLGSLMEGLVQ